MKKPLIAGNWKMNNNIVETRAFFDELKPLLGGESCEVTVCVPYTDIHTAVEEAAGSGVSIGAQNVAWADKGAFTGEISAAMLRELGCKYVVIGHSERRAMFGETDESVNKRLVKALEAGLKPIVCVGETLSQRETGTTQEVLRRQLEAGLKGIDSSGADKIIVAYEPVWAIGTGRTAAPAEAGETVSYIRRELMEIFGSDSREIRVLYGGSMNAGNARELMDSGIDGGLIGGASLKAEDFIKVIRYDK